MCFNLKSVAHFWEHKRSDKMLFLSKHVTCGICFPAPWCFGHSPSHAHFYLMWDRSLADKGRAYQSAMPIQRMLLWLIYYLIKENIIKLKTTFYFMDNPTVNILNNTIIEGFDNVLNRREGRKFRLPPPHPPKHPQILKKSTFSKWIRWLIGLLFKNKPLKCLIQE